MSVYLKNAAALVSGLSLLVAACGADSFADNALQQTPAEDIGIAIKAVDAALENYQDSAAMATVVLYGTDTRYYILIRGWLLQRIAGLESQTLTDSSPAQLQELEFLRQALRRIDLE